jgi:pyruvate kinase
VVLAEEIHAKGIVVLTDKEEHIRILAASRPKMPIFAFVPNSGIQARTVLYRGVYPPRDAKGGKGKGSNEGSGEHYSKNSDG